jgi:hypothetical protein
VAASMASGSFLQFFEASILPGNHLTVSCWFIMVLFLLQLFLIIERTMTESSRILIWEGGGRSEIEI